MADPRVAFGIRDRYRDHHLDALDRRRGRSFRGAGSRVFAAGMLGLTSVAFMWWRDVVIEAETGQHTPVVQIHQRYGMLLSIAWSDVLRRLVLAYFDAALFPNCASYTLENVQQAIGLVKRNQLFGGQWPARCRLK